MIDIMTWTVTCILRWKSEMLGHHFQKGEFAWGGGGGEGGG